VSHKQILILAALAGGALSGCGPDPDAIARKRGADLFAGRCSACHAQDARGLEGLGANLRSSDVVASLSDDELLDYIKQGVEPTDTHAGMPPKGGWATLTDDHLRDIIAYIRSVSEHPDG